MSASPATKRIVHFIGSEQLQDAEKEIRKLAQREGMSFLRESAIDRVKRGLTTLKEINKVTFIEASR